MINKVRVYNIENAIYEVLRYLEDSTFGIIPLDAINDIIDGENLSEEDNVKAYLNYILYQDNGMVEYAIIGDKDMKRINKLDKTAKKRLLSFILVSFALDGKFTSTNYYELKNLGVHNREIESMMEQLPYAEELLFD